MKTIITTIAGLLILIFISLVIADAKASDTLAKKGFSDASLMESAGKTVKSNIKATPPESWFKISRRFGDISDAPEINFLIASLWGIWVGWIMSTVGAFGGIMAGVGHITILGLGDYAATFQTADPAFNRALTDTIRVSNQFLVGVAALIATFKFLKLGRLVWPLGIALGAGSVLGALLIPWLTAGKVRLDQYLGYFGLAVLLIGCFLLYETTPRGRAGKKKVKEAESAFRNASGKKRDKNDGVRVINFSLKKITFTFFGVEFSFNPALPVAGGFLIAGLSSFIGVGGGFLYVPLMTSIVGLPMFLVAGTSALAILMSMTTSIFTYTVIKGVYIYWPLIFIEALGIFAGVAIGVKTQKYIPEIWLKRLFVALSIYVGLRYFSKGFLGYSWLPPF